MILGNKEKFKFWKNVETNSKVGKDLGLDVKVIDLFIVIINTYSSIE